MASSHFFAITECFAQPLGANIHSELFALFRKGIADGLLQAFSLIFRAANLLAQFGVVPGAIRQVVHQLGA